jgi:hypothetical protein
MVRKSHENSQPNGKQKNNYLRYNYTMDDKTKIGLTSLYERLIQIEKELGKEIPSMSQPVTFENLAEIMDDQNSKYKQIELSKIRQHFLEGIYLNFGEEIEATNITKYIEYAVKYVEANSAKIAILLKTDVSSELKFQTCYVLVKELCVNANIDEKLISSIINHLVSLVYHKEEAKVIEELPVPQKPKKKYLKFCLK